MVFGLLKCNISTIDLEVKTARSTSSIIVTTQPNINLTQLRLRLDIIINPNPPHPRNPHKLPKLAIWETSKSNHCLGPA